MIDLEVVISRLAEVGELKTVGGAADFSAAVQQAPKQLPAAFVLPGDETPGKNTLASGGVDQRVAAGVRIAIAVSNLADPTGRRAQQTLMPARLAIRNQLGAWQVGVDFDPFELAPGKMLPLRPGVLWWMDGFKTAYHWRKV